MVFKINHSVSSSYKVLAVVFLVQAISLTIIRGIFKDQFGDDYLLYLGPLVMPVGVLFFISIIRLVRNLGVSTNLLRLILLLFFTALFFRIITALGFVEGNWLSISTMLSSILLCMMQIMCTYFMCINLFIQEKSLIEKLWASVCVYFMIGATFGTIYSFLMFLDPNALGFEVLNPFDIYIDGIVYSLNVISGLDPLYQNTSETMYLTAILESIFTTLFLVILIGRLLGSSSTNEK